MFEARPELGGLMRYGIPAYRLSRAVLDGEIARIVALGIDVHCNQAMDTTAALAQLQQDYDAVYLATGAARQRRLPGLDYDPGWVMDGAAYLAACNADAPPSLGKRVVVIGGGSAALDAARSARRAGHAVTLLALEKRAQMPAQAEEVHEALEEGIELVDGARLDRVDASVDGARYIRCTRVDFVAGAMRGQFTLTPVPDSGFTLIADAIITSIGQDPDLAMLGRHFAVVGSLMQVDARQATSVPGVYAGGDVASMARFVTEAVGMGKRAAQAIVRDLGRRHAVTDGATVDALEDLVPLAAIATFYHPARARAQSHLLPAAERVTRNAEVQQGLELEQVLA
ncbi:MAG: FAD-dependent oxidoreductase, partial [Rhodoferax sp.]